MRLFYLVNKKQGKIKSNEWSQLELVGIIMRSLKSNGWKHHQNGALEKKGRDKEMCFGQHQDK